MLRRFRRPMLLYAQDDIFFAVFGSRRRLVRGVVTMPPVPPRTLRELSLALELRADSSS